MSEEPKDPQTTSPMAPSSGPLGSGGPGPDSVVQQPIAEDAVGAQQPGVPDALGAQQAGVEEARPQPVGAPHAGARQSSAELEGRPSYVFFGSVAAIALLLDIGTKAWAEITLTKTPTIEVIRGHLMFVLAYNKGGAWGLLQDKSEVVRLPFFLGVSVLAVLFIISLYGKLAPDQRALKWGLPLVLGGALGNLSDRITRSSVIDFIDYRADWVLAMNQGIAKLARGWNTTDHWPTFNVADIAICVGVGLMAIDMFTSKRSQPEPAPVANATPPAE